MTDGKRTNRLQPTRALFHRQARACAPRRVSILAGLLLVGSLSSCSLVGLGAAVTTTKVVTHQSSEVTAFVTVRDGDEPVGYLSASNFEVYENDVLLDDDKVHLRVLSREGVASGHTVLLLDLSGQPEPAELKGISRGAAHFVEKVTTTQAVTVVAFDGSERAREVAKFSQVPAPTKRPLPPLEPFLSKDPSRDLNNAVLAAIKGLAARMRDPGESVQFGTVVTLVRGPDLAGRTDDNTLQKAIRESGFEFYSIAPEEVNFGTLSNIGRDKRFAYDSLDTLPLRFQDLGMRVRAAWQSHYLIAYCSPSRSGVRKLKVRAAFESESGESRSGSSVSEFDASGFEAGCGPTTEKPLISVPEQAEVPVGPDGEEPQKHRRVRTITGETAAPTPLEPPKDP